MMIEHSSYLSSRLECVPAAPCELHHAVDAQIAQLRSERQAYAARISQLAGRRDRAHEVGSYLLMIECINKALLRIACAAVGPDVAIGGRTM